MINKPFLRTRHNSSKISDKFITNFVGETVPTTPKLRKSQSNFHIKTA